jgi:hypothetical protein
MRWNDLTFPPPTNRQRIKEYQHDDQTTPGGGSQRYNHHHYYDHNLYLLCGGAEELYGESDDDQPDPGFMVLAILVGMVMISMICTELQQFGGGGSSDRSRGSNGRNRRPSGYELPPTQELEMV